MHDLKVRAQPHSSMATKPSAQELVARARALAPTIRGAAQLTEQDRRVPVTTTKMLRDADLFRLMQPAQFGGFEYGFGTLIDIVAEVGAACGSTAWCYGLGAVHQWLVGTFPSAAQQDVWGDNPQALVCGSYAPAGQVSRASASEGYTIQGRWGFASNCQNSDWAMLGVILPSEDETSQPEPGFLLVPKQDYEIEDTWFTVGLSGTGSNTIVVKEPLFVPGHRKLTFAQASSGRPPGADANTNPLYRIPFLSAIPVSIVSPAIGMVQGSLDEFVEWAGSRTTRGAVAGGGNPLAQFPQVQSRVAYASATLDAARLLLKRDVNEVESEVLKGHPISIDMRIRNRRDHAFVAKMLTQAANELFDAVGGAGLSLTNGIQRNWRDTNALARHISMNWDAVSSMYGQHRLGLVPKGQF